MNHIRDLAGRLALRVKRFWPMSGRRGAFPQPSLRFTQPYDLFVLFRWELFTAFDGCF